MYSLKEKKKHKRDDTDISLGKEMIQISLWEKMIQMSRWEKRYSAENELIIE